MQSNYKRLGDFIQEVNIKNSNLKVTNLIGVSIDKKFIKSVANTIGVDMANYKVIKKNQLACKLMSVGRDEKLPVDLYIDEQPSLVSSAYYVFEPKDKNKLLPEYLKMWLFRSETDRYVGYISGGDVRGGISWDTFCEIPIKVPSIEKQLEIIKEYHIIQNHIVLNNQLIAKLEETAQTIYKQWFVDFEFPVSDTEALEVTDKPKGYKSSGGKMVWCEELEKEIPEGWEIDNLGSYSKISAGGDMPKVFSKTKTDLCEIPVLSNSSANEGLYGYTNKAIVFEKCITISARGAIIGYTVLRLKEFFPIVRLIVVKPLNEDFLNYLFYTVLNFKFDNQTSSAQGQLTVPDISSYKVVKPDDSILIKFQKQSSVIINNIDRIKKENQKLEELKELLLGRMVRES